MQEKSLIKKNILKYIENKGISKYSFYKQTGITRGVLDQDNGMSEENTARFLARFDDVNAEWLILGKGNMFKGTTQEIYQPVTTASEPNIISYALRTDRVIDEQDIPVYEIQATAGLVSLFDDNYKKPTPITYIRIPKIGKCDGALFATGDSMYPVLKSGDIVAYKQVNDIANNLFWGEMYIISMMLDDEEYITIKYIQKSDEPGHIKLVSHNQHHAPKDIPVNVIRAMAFVKASVRYNVMH